MTDLIDLPINDVHIFYTDIKSQLSNINYYKSILDKSELVRSNEMFSEKKKQRYIIGRGLTRHKLGKYLGIEPRTLLIDLSDNGKPFIQGHDIHFNISHSAGHLALAFAKMPVGIDIELIKDIRNMEKILNRFFPFEKVRILNLKTSKEQQKAFFKLWTGFEAQIKMGANTVWNSLRISDQDLTATINKPRIKYFSINAYLLAIATKEEYLNYELRDC